MTSMPHISPSALGMYLRCGEQYRRRYIDGDRRPPGWAMVIGTGAHAGAEARHRQRMIDGTEMPVAEIVDRSVAAYDGAVADGVALGDGETIDAGRDATAELGRGVATHVAPAILRPIAVEDTITIPIPSRGIDLVGRIDVAHEVDGRIIVEDLKTGARRPAAGMAEGSRQLAWYAMAWRYLHGDLPAEVGMRHLWRRSEDVATSWAPVVPVDADIAALLASIDVVLRGIDAGIFAPAHEGAWWCAPASCGYYSDCRYRSR